MLNVIKFKKGALALKMLALVAFTWFMLVGFGSLVKSEETELVMLQMIFRHGDRTPLHKYPNDPNDLSFWDKFGGYGVLTPNGRKQAYNYGKILYFYLVCVFSVLRVFENKFFDPFENLRKKFFSNRLFSFIEVYI